MRDELRQSFAFPDTRPGNDYNDIVPDRVPSSADYESFVPDSKLYNRFARPRALKLRVTRVHSGLLFLSVGDSGGRLTCC
jgi:hypothetical protein